MKKKIASHVISKLTDIAGVEITKPKDISFGHYCTPISFSLAKTLKKSPHQIAHDLSLELEHGGLFDSVSAISGYINFKLSDSFLDSFATDALVSGANYAKESQNGKYLVEYVSANPTGPLHIGHARGAVYGDVLVRVGRHLGYDIKTEYYVNDAGNQVKLLGDSLFYAGKREVLKEAVEFPEGSYKGEYIAEVAVKAAEHFGKEIFKDESRIDELAVWGKDQMLEIIKDNLRAAKIEFDSFVSEKEVFAKWESVRADLEKKGGLYTQDDKVYLKSSQFGDGHDRVVVRDNGIPTYLAGDIVYHDDKFKRGYDHYINIWGADHHGYIDRVKAAVEFLGYDSKKLEIILSQMVALLKNGEPYKMSKRAGNFILMSDVVEDIGIDALRFIFMTKKSDTHLEFDVDTLRKEDSSNPVFYVNYAHARIKSVFKKLEIDEKSVYGVKLENLKDDAKEILFEALVLPEILDDAFHSRNLQLLTDYLYKLSARFHRFYTENKVIGSENQEQLLKIFAIVGLSIRTALSLLGIEAKDRMDRD
ncbi:MAG: arginyl-tRNA synthetase [Campylobacterota bacterium]|nr:arginyl-tRNA synthetase [Campylobacterota bacterium]